MAKGAARIAPLMLYLCLHLQLRGIEFEGRGYIAIAYADQDAVRKPVRRYSFTLSLKNHLWNIRTNPSGARTHSGSEPIAYYEAGTDGTNIFWFTRFNEAYNHVAGRKRLLDDLAAAEEKIRASGAHNSGLARIQRFRRFVERQQTEGRPTLTAKNTAVAEVDPVAIPRFSQADLIAPLWLAYCSGPYFEHLGGGIVPRVFQEVSMNGSIRSNLLCRGSFSMSEEQPRLPRVIHFLKDVATYEATQFKNYHGIILPSNVRLERRAQTGAEAKLVFSISAKLTEVNARRVSRSRFVPDITAVTKVQDNRFLFDQRVDQPIGYFAESNRWWTLSEVMKGREYQNQMLSRRRTAASPFSRRIFIYCCLFLVTMLTAYDLLKTRRLPRS